MMGIKMYHVYTISPDQGKKKTVTYTDNFELVEQLCKEHILYAYELVDLNSNAVLSEPKVCVNY